MDQIARADPGPEALRLRHQFWELYWGEMAIVESNDVESIMIQVGKILDQHKMGPLPEPARRQLKTLAAKIREKNLGLYR